MNPAPASAGAAAAPSTLRRNIRWMVLAMTAYILNDALVKVVSAGLPAGQLIFVRGVLATTLGPTPTPARPTLLWL